MARPSANPLFVTTQMDSQKSLIYIEMFLAYLSTSVKKKIKKIHVWETLISYSDPTV